MNAALAVNPLGQRVRWIHVWIRSFLFLFSSIISGAWIGFLLTLLIYTTSFWIAMQFKLLLLLAILMLCIGKELGLLRLHIPQRKWQIPISWVKVSAIQNMLVFGVFLGAGIFTYNPYASFLILYLYLGFFLDPLMGIYYGMLYGLARAATPILLGVISNHDHEKQSWLVRQIWCKERYYHILHACVLIILFCYMIYHSLFTYFQLQ